MSSRDAAGPEGPGEPDARGASAGGAGDVDGTQGPDRRWAWRLATALVVLASCWPWLATLTYPPMAVDTEPWLSRADPASEGWLGFVFDTRHFRVGYRPLTALTFSLDARLFGTAALGLRGTDLALHLLALLGVGCAARALLPGRRGWTLVAVALFALHPAVEEVVPFSARRSYTLAVGLSLLGVAQAVRAARGEPGRGEPARAAGPGRVAARATLAGLWLAAGVLSNEVAGVAVGGALLLAWATLPGGRGFAARALAGVLGLVAPVAVALALRARVVEGLGGYRLQEGEGAPYLELLASSWADTLALPGSAPALALGVGCAWVALLVGRGALGLARGGARAGAGVSLALGVWLGTYGLLFAGQGVWYGRQALPIAAVLALALAWTLAGGAEGAGGAASRPGPPRLDRWPALALALAVLLAAPALRGPDPRRREIWSLRRDLIEALLAIPEQVEAPAEVRLVLPFHRADDEETDLQAAAVNMLLPRDARQPARWAQHVLGSDAVLLTEYAYVEEARTAFEAPARAEAVDGRTRLVLPVDREVLLIEISRPRLRDPERGPVQALPRARRGEPRAEYLFLYGPRGGRLEPVLRGGRGR